MPKKILICCDYASTWDIGGATRVLAHQIDACKKNQLECELLSGVPQRDDGSFGVPWHQVPYKTIAYLPKLLWHCFRLRYGFKPDILHLHQPLIGWCAHLMFPTSVQRVYHFHSYWGLEKKSHAKTKLQLLVSWIKANIEKSLLKRLRHFIVLSEYSRELLATSLHQEAQVTLIPAAVKERSLRQQDIKEAQQNDPELSQNQPFRWLSVRRLDPRMGLDVLLQALAQLEDRRWTLTIVGSGRQEAELKLSCEQLGLSNQVVFAGRVSEQVLKEHLESHDAMVIPTKAMEGFGLSVLEAWAAGLPVLATRVGALSEFEKHGEAIHLVDTCSVESLKVGLTWARSHWKDHKAMADACQDVIKSNYDWDQVGRRYLEVYGSLS